MHDAWDVLSAYLAAAVVMLAANTDTILAWGGPLLLCVQLIADVPRAIRELRGWFKRG